MVNGLSVSLAVFVVRLAIVRPVNIVGAIIPKDFV